LKLGGGEDISKITTHQGEIHNSGNSKAIAL